MLAEGQGVQKDRAEAAGLFEMAAAKKHPLANYNLALLFLTGDGKPENPLSRRDAHALCRRGRRAAAQYDLGTLYATGTGVEPNAFEAAKWIGKAAAAGHPEAQVDYAVMLFRGQGVPVDQKRGAEISAPAAEKGLASAQIRLARCLAQGAGVEHNLVEAAKWHLIAKSGGLTDEVWRRCWRNCRRPTAPRRRRRPSSGGIGRWWGWSRGWGVRLKQERAVAQ